MEHAEKRRMQEDMPDQLRILVVGNNPIDLSRIFDTLKGDKMKDIITETAFDLKSVTERLSKFRPNYILIDDNVGKAELKMTMGYLLSDRRTKEVPITVIKNSNYQEFIDMGILSYVLKDTITIDSLYRELQNTFRLKRTQRYVYEAYRKRKGQFMRLLKFNRDPVFR